ncbi:MAG: hypothetical protein RSA65_05980, partial [Clostridia bacterium]
MRGFLGVPAIFWPVFSFCHSFYDIAKKRSQTEGFMLLCCYQTIEKGVSLVPKIDVTKKQNALQSIEHVGVRQTHEDTGISIQTLYKWKNEKQHSSQASHTNSTLEIAKLLENDKLLETKIKQLEDENEKQRAL